MQLGSSRKGSIGKLLARASLSLVSATSSVAVAQDARDDVPQHKQGFFKSKYKAAKNWADWSGEIGFLGYSESDGRVTALEPAISLSAAFENGSVWNTKLVIDSLTGSSPNGTLISEQPQTFTTPSGESSYTIQAGEIPLDDTFLDTRINLSSSFLKPLSRTVIWQTGLNLSTEYDYLSLGINSTLGIESEDKNTSYSVGVALASDEISAVGGIPTPFAAMVDAGEELPRLGASDTKTIYDLLLGVSQVISKSWIVQANLSLGYSAGYHNDPYKIVTVFDQSAGPSLGDPLSYLYEQRPDSRSKQSLYLASKNHLGAGVLTSSYRYYSDDWGLSSRTIGLWYSFALNERWRVEPGIRFYDQSAVDFYDFAIGDEEARPEFLTADNRLGDLTALTPSVKFTKKLPNEKEYSLVLKYYSQSGDSSPSEAVGSQIGLDLFPDVNAYILQIGYSF